MKYSRTKFWLTISQNINPKIKSAVLINIGVSGLVSVIQQARNMNRAEALNEYQLLQCETILSLITEGLQFSK